MFTYKSFSKGDKINMVYSKVTKEEFTNLVIEEIVKGPTSVGQKIQALVKIRRENHGNFEIQDKCNKHLDELYNKKYEMLSRGEKIW